MLYLIFHERYFLYYGNIPRDKPFVGLNHPVDSRTMGKRRGYGTGFQDEPTYNVDLHPLSH